MAAYLTMQIMKGNLDYVAVTTHPTWKQFKDDIDAILVAEGKEDLIVA